jgi:hypothetical protein
MTGVFVKKVVFVCVENSNRSQMAEAFARIHGTGKIEVLQGFARLLRDRVAGVKLPKSVLFCEKV